MDVARKGKFIQVKVQRKPNPNYKPGKDKNIDVIIGRMVDGKELVSYSPNLELTLEELSRYNIPVTFKANK